MNIIEQLGGYEKCKDILSRPNIDFIMNAQGLREHMLEYRRQHNIYEAGDWIVIDSYKPEYQFYQITKDDVNSHWINLVEFRHATDAEIKAGHRLS